MPFGNTRAESRRDSVSKPRVASRELPWVNIVRRPLPRRGCDHRASPEAATPLGLEIARTLTQGSLADSATLGWRTQSLWDGRPTDLSVVPHGTGLAGNMRKMPGESGAYRRQVLQRFGVAAKGLEPCESGRQLEQQREQLPGGEPQQQQPDQPEQQPRVPFRPAPSSTRLPDGSGADPAAILSPAAVLPGQIREQKPPGASRLAEPVENSGRPCASFRTDGGAAKSSVRNDMFIATRAPESAKLRRSVMSLRSLGCRWAYAAPTELDRASGAVVAINMSLLTELAGPLMAAPHDSANDNSAKHDSVLP